MTEPSEYPTPRPGIVVTDLKDLLRVNNFDLAWEFALIEDKLHTAAKDAEYWKAQTEQARSRSVEATNARVEVSQAFNHFKTQVREIAIRVAKEQDWCRDGLNEVLAELDLPEYNPAKYVEFRVRVLVEGDNADDNDYAEQYAYSVINKLYDDEASIEEIDHRRTWDKDE